MDIEKKLNEVYHKGIKSFTSVASWSALLILLSWNFIEWLICLLLGPGPMLWLCGSLLDTIVNAAVILFMVHGRKWDDCWTWVGIIFLFNTLPCVLPLKLGNGYLLDIFLILFQLFVVLLGDLIGNFVILLAVKYYPLDYNILEQYDKIFNKFMNKKPEEAEAVVTEKAVEEVNPYVGGFEAVAVPEELSFGGFGGLSGDAEIDIQPAEAEEPEVVEVVEVDSSSDKGDTEPAGGGFGGGFS